MKGCLRSYLVCHRNEFMKSLERYEKNHHLDTFVSSPNFRIPHDVELLHVWAFQVRERHILLALLVKVFSLILTYKFHTILGYFLNFVECKWHGIFVK